MAMTEGRSIRRKASHDINQNTVRAEAAISEDPVNPMNCFVGYKIRRLQHAIIGELRDILASFALRIMDFAILRIVEANPGLAQNAVAKLLGAEPPAVVLSLDRLQAMKYIQRKQSPDDRRLRMLHLTAAGTKLLKRAMTEVEHQEQRMKRSVRGDYSKMVACLDDMLLAYGVL